MEIGFFCEVGPLEKGCLTVSKDSTLRPLIKVHEPLESSKIPKVLLKRYEKEQDDFELLRSFNFEW